MELYWRYWLYGFKWRFVEGRKEDYTIVNDKKIYNFDIETPIRSLTDVTDCDCIGKPNENGSKDLGLHIIFAKEFEDKYKDYEQLANRLSEFQEILYKQYNNIDMVPMYFKIRNNFPYKPSGKRDTEFLSKETEGFIYIDKSNLLENKEKVKRK